MKESKYVRLASTIYRVLRNSRTPLFLHRKSNHVFSLWQHIVLLTVRQYEGMNYRMFAEWLEWLASWSLLSQNISSIIPYPALYYSPEVFFQNKWYAIGEDNFLIHIITYKHQKNIYRNDSTGFKKDNSCFTVLYWTNRIEKKICEIIYWSWCDTTANYMYS